MRLVGISIMNKEVSEPNVSVSKKVGYLFELAIHKDIPLFPSFNNMTSMSLSLATVSLLNILLIDFKDFVTYLYYMEKEYASPVRISSYSM